jgi:hypothetical protein
MEPGKRFKVIFKSPLGDVMTKWWTLAEINELLPPERWRGWVGLWEDSWVGCDGDTLFMLSPEYRAMCKRLIEGLRHVRKLEYQEGGETVNQVTP